MPLKDDLSAYDRDEREAFVRLQHEHPEKEPEELIHEVADAFRGRWFDLLRASGHPVNDPRVDDLKK